VTKVAIGPFTLTGQAATAQVKVTVSGPGKVTVSATFTGSPAATRKVRSAAVISDSPQTVSGSGTHPLKFTHNFSNECFASATVSVTTSPSVKPVTLTAGNGEKCPPPTTPTPQGRIK
jgi:hypothetical protein